MVTQVLAGHVQTYNTRILTTDPSIGTFDVFFGSFRYFSLYRRLRIEDDKYQQDTSVSIAKRDGVCLYDSHPHVPQLLYQSQLVMQWLVPAAGDHQSQLGKSRRLYWIHLRYKHSSLRMRLKRQIS